MAPVPGNGPSIDRERAAAWALALALVAASLVVGYFATPHAAPGEEVRAVRADPDVAVSTVEGGYVLSPARGEPRAGLVFYPGARVDPSAYVPVLAPVAARAGVAIHVPKPPLNLAVLEPDMAAGAVDAAPGAEWYVGGHSLGGAMACRFAADDPDRVAGVVLLAAYCDRDISDTGLRVLIVRGGADEVLDRRAYRRNLGNLPPNRTVARTIPGMNHSQFGAYAGQPGDRPANVSDDRARAELRRLLVEFLSRPRAASDRRGPDPR